MLKAQELDEEEAEAFMLYKPRFIMDTEFKLEREPADTIENLSALMENEICFEFGSF
jgi:hypothetical protein